MASVPSISPQSLLPLSKPKPKSKPISNCSQTTPLFLRNKQKIRIKDTTLKRRPNFKVQTTIILELGIFRSWTNLLFQSSYSFVPCNIVLINTTLLTCKSNIYDRMGRNPIKQIVKESRNSMTEWENCYQNFQNCVS